MPTPERPRVIVAGEYAFEFYEPAFAAGLERAGARVERFVDRAWLGPGEAVRRVQRHFVRGPGVAMARAALLARVARSRPDVLLGWRASPTTTTIPSAPIVRSGSGVPTGRRCPPSTSRTSTEP
jgi:hypothetical protein